MEIKMTSAMLKKNLPHVYDRFYRKFGEKRFDVKIEKVDDITYHITQIPFKTTWGITFKNEFPSDSDRISPEQAKFLDKKFK